MSINEKLLKDKKFLEEIRSKAYDMMFYDLPNEAYHLAMELDESLKKIKDFKDSNNDLYKEFLKIIIRLKWVGLPIMENEMVLEMFKEHFSEIYKIPDFDLWFKLKPLLLSMLIFEERDGFKKELREALKHNNGKLTINKLLVGSQQIEGTIGNWIIDYNTFLGTGAADSLRKSEYFIKSENIKKLNDNEKKKIKIFLSNLRRVRRGHPCR